MTTKQTTKNRSGFTFSATLAAGMAVSLTATTILATTTSTADDVAVKVAAERFEASYKKARSIAVRSGRTAEIRIDGNHLWIEVDATAYGTGERERVGKVVDLGLGGVTVETNRASLCITSSGTAQIRGRCSVAGGEIEFSKGSSAKTVVTTATGIISG